MQFTRYQITQSLYCLIVSTLLGLLTSESLGQGTMRKGTITRNVDGDTVWFQPAGKTEKDRLSLRMLGLDAPETGFPTSEGPKGQIPWGKKATATLTRLIPVGTKVTIEDQGFDKWERTLARVYLDGEDIDLAMVKKGWAIPYIICDGKPCTHNFLQNEKVSEYVKACENARKRETGIFDPENPMDEMPFEFRMRLSGRTPDKWVGDFYSRELFDPEDYEEVDVCARVFFMKRHLAEGAGFDVSVLESQSLIGQAFAGF